MDKLFFHLAQLSHSFTHYAVSFCSFSGTDNFLACKIASSEDWAFLVVSLSLTLGVAVGGDEVIEVVAIIIYVLVAHVAYYSSRRDVGSDFSLKVTTAIISICHNRVSYLSIIEGEYASCVL